MIRLKTAVLLACSLKTGALAVQAPGKEAGKLYDLGINLGLAFQLQDDMLDAYGDTRSFGKKIGGDIMAGKKTYLLIHVLKHSGPDDRKHLISWLKNKQCTREEKLTAVKRIFDQYSVLEKIKSLVDHYFDQAGEIMHSITVDDARKAPLREFIEKLKNRGR
jgi:geranylgeranyl diphosphate synthase type II